MSITFYFILASVGWQYECDKCTVSASLVGIPIRNCIIRHGTITMMLYVQLRSVIVRTIRFVVSCVDLAVRMWVFIIYMRADGFLEYKRQGENRATFV
jgi:hypothetical protein